MFGKDPIRLSLRPRGGHQGEPYGDDVVAVVRRLVEETRLSHKEIGARAGVSHMTVCRWTRSGNWRRPPGTTRRIPEMPAGPGDNDKRIPGAKAWRLMREAEALLDEPAAESAHLDRLERALELVREVREIHTQMAAPKRRPG